MTKHVKSSLQSLVVEISYWTTFHFVDQLRLITIKSCYNLRRINVIDMAYWKYPNQELKMIYSNLVMLVTLMRGFHISNIYGHYYVILIT